MKVFHRCRLTADCLLGRIDLNKSSTSAMRCHKPSRLSLLLITAQNLTKNSVADLIHLDASVFANLRSNFRSHLKF